MSMKQTFSGVAWDLNAPHYSKVFLGDILTSLESINRFDGHTKRPLSVLKHSLLVAKLANAEAKPYALLHDVHEAYLGDMTTPVAHAIDMRLSDYGVGGHFEWVWGGLKHDHDIQIWKAFGLAPPTNAIVDEVCRADREALASEKEYFLHSPRDESVKMWGDLPEPCSKKKAMHCYRISNIEARKKFVNACEIYGMTLPPMWPVGFKPEEEWAR